MNGVKYEYEFINYLDNRRFKSINNNFKELLLALFPDIKDDTFIYAWKYKKYAKTDVAIEVNGIRKGLSIKTGNNNSVHLELIKSITEYLESLGFGEINNFLSYLYSDGTNNNTGLCRMPVCEYKIKHKMEILRINHQLKIISKPLIDRFLFEGTSAYDIPVDIVIHGKVDDFLWATREEITNYLLSKEVYSLGVHIGSLFIQLWNKNLNRNEKYEHCRNYMQVKWYSVFDDLSNITSKRNNL